MANEKNLIPQAHTLTVEEASKGGKNSVEARRNKKILRDCLEMLLEKEISDKSGNKMTGAEAMAAVVFQKAIKGDLKAFEIVRDTAGQKPVEKVVISEIDTDVINEVERMVNDDEETGG